MGKAEPFLKWAGGKRRLAPKIVALMPERIGGYCEPFLGGGAVFFALYNAGRLDDALAAGRVTLGDVNEEVVVCWRAVRDDVEGVLRAFRRHQAHAGDRAHYDRVRSWDRQPGFASLPPAERAARFIYLNRACYNGLCRFNREGKFNAPFGGNRSLFVDENALRAASRALQNVAIVVGDFMQTIDAAQMRSGDAAYFDPPYLPQSQTSRFTEYSRFSFGVADMMRVVIAARRLADCGAHVVVSADKSSEALFLETANAIIAVDAQRCVSGSFRGRGVVAEIIAAFSSPRTFRRDL